MLSTTYGDLIREYGVPPMETDRRFNPSMEDLPEEIQGLRRTVALNVRRLIAHLDIPEQEFAKPEQLSAGSANRIKHGQNVTLQVLQGAAKRLNVPAWQLLYPDYDPADPPLLTTEREIQERVQAELHEFLEARRAEKAPPASEAARPADHHAVAHRKAQAGRKKTGRAKATKP